jgi:hypothetical protein
MLTDCSGYEAFTSCYDGYGIISSNQETIGCFRANIAGSVGL